MPGALALEKVQWKLLVCSMLTAGSNCKVTTDSQEKHAAKILRSYNVIFCGDLVFGRMFFKTRKKILKAKRNCFNGVLYLRRLNVPLCTAKLHGLEEHSVMRRRFWLSPLKRLLCSSCSQHRNLIFYQAAETIETPNFFKKTLLFSS